MAAKFKISVTSVLLFLGFILAVILVFTTQNSYGGADSIQHYSLAKWGWKYPHLLLNHWGKPLFTMLLSPFAQFGFKGAQLYNLILAFLTSVIIWKIARLINILNHKYVPLLVIVTPIYMVLMFTSLTEITFSFFISLAILLFLDKKFFLSALFVSLLPLVRTEAIVLLPLFIIAFISERKAFYIIFFTVGFWVLSLIGYSYYDDFWWLITKMPYSGDAKSIYGSGTLYHFIINESDTRDIIGKVLSIFFWFGLLLTLLKWGKSDKFRISQSFYLLVLVFGSFILFFVAHSFVWWRGMGNSLGLLRVIGSVAPLAVLGSIIGIEKAIELIPIRMKFIRGNFGYFLVAIIFLMSIKDYRGSFFRSEPQKILDTSIDYLKENQLLSNKIYYFNPYVIYKIGIDPYDFKLSLNGIENKQKPSVGIPNGSIIVWDAHFGPNEGGVSLESLKNEKALKEISTFKPEKPFKVLGGYDYEVKIFQKDLSLNSSLMNEVHYDFEGIESITDIPPKTGKNCKKMTPNDIYSEGMAGYLEEMIDTTSGLIVSVSGYIYSKDTLNAALPIICAVYDKSETHSFRAKDIREFVDVNNTWQYFQYYFYIPRLNSLDKLLKVYIWNNNKQEFYLDDLHYSISSVSNITYYEDTTDFLSSAEEQQTNKYSIRSTDKYSNGLEIPMSSLCNDSCELNATISGFLKTSDALVSELPLVFSADMDSNGIYKTFDLRNSTLVENNWYYFETSFPISYDGINEALLKVYVWNKNGISFELKNLKIKID